MAARTIEYMPVADLAEAPRNPKNHAEDELTASMARFGYVEPIILDERTGRIVSGHGRKHELLRGQEAGETPPDGVLVADDGSWMAPVSRGWASKDDAEAEAFVIAANRIGERGGWHDDLLADVLVDLAKMDDGFVGVGYTGDDLSSLLESLGRDVDVSAHTRHLGDPDDVPDPPAVPITQPGDLWLLGPHRLLCGDATRREDYDRVLAGEHLAGAVVTDPPYGVGIGAKNRALDAIDRSGRVLTDLEGDRTMAEVEPLWRSTLAVLHELMAPGTPYYVFGVGSFADPLLLLLLRESGLAARHILVWVKNRATFSFGRLDYEYQHELIAYGWMPGAAHPWHGTEQRTTTLFVDRPQSSPDHPTVKPVELISQLIRNSTAPNGMVLDPFMGSGTTVVAADMEGRRAYGLEISPHYCDVACRRWQALTGAKPVLERTGEPHDFLAS